VADKPLREKNSFESGTLEIRKRKEQDDRIAFITPIERRPPETGPWAGRKIKLTPDWYVAEISRRIKNINWKNAAEDVMRFLPLKEMENIEHWSSDFFLYHAGRLRETLRGK